jgi:hypothetical protein
MNMIHNESYVKILCPNESFMVTFELIAMHFVPSRIVKKNHSLELIIEGYKDLKEVVFYTWPTFSNRYHPSLGSSDDTQPLGKWRVGPTLIFH